MKGLHLEEERIAESKVAYLQAWLEGEGVFTITQACAQAGVSRARYYAWIADDPEFKKLARETERAGKQRNLDSVRGQAYKKANQGSERMICYLLDRLDPEYAPKVYSQQHIEGEITLKHVREKADDNSDGG